LTFTPTALPTVAVGAGQGWRLLAAPGDAETLASFLEPVWTQGGSDYDASGGAPNVYLYKEAAPGDMAAGWSAPPGFVPLGPGVGAAVYLFADDNFDGEADPFPKALPLHGAEPTLPFVWDSVEGDAYIGYTNNESDDDGWNLLGNPSRSPLDWSAIWNTTFPPSPSTGDRDSTVSPIAYGYDAKSGWSSYDAYLGAGSGTGPMASRRIPAGTGFLVQAIAENPSLTAPASGEERLRAAEPAPHVAVYVEAGDQAAGSTISGGATLVFVKGAAVGPDRYDVPSLAPLGSPAVWVAAVETEGSPALMQSRLPAALDQPTEVDLAVGLDGVAPTAEITWDAALPAGWRAILLDRQTGAEVEMTAGGHYAVDLTGAAIVDGRPTVGRLAIRVVPAGATAGEPGMTVAEVSLARPNPASGRSAVRVAVPVAERVRVSVLDALGREVAVAFDAVVSGAREVPLDTARLAPGVYVVRVVGTSFAESRALTVVR